MGKQILDIQHTTYIVLIVLIDRDAAVIVFHDTVEHVGKRTADFDIHDILTTGHHLLGRLVAKTDDTLQDALLLFYFLLVGELQRLLQVVYTQHMTVLAHHLFHPCHTTDEQCLQRPKQPAHQHDAPYGLTTET